MKPWFLQDEPEPLPLFELLETFTVHRGKVNLALEGTVKFGTAHLTPRVYIMQKNV